MGGWSSHPLGNDDALDAECRIRRLADLEEDYAGDEPKPLTAEDVPALLEAVTEADVEDRYVLPWMLHANQIRITDPAHSAQIKELIAGTPNIYQSTPGEKPAIILSEILEQYWDRIMDGSVPFEVVPTDMGLVASVIEHQVKARPGILMNRPAV